MSEIVNETANAPDYEALKQARRRKNWVVMGLLIVLIALIYALTIVKMSGH